MACSKYWTDLAVKMFEQALDYCGDAEVAKSRVASALTELADYNLPTAELIAESAMSKALGGSR